MSEMKKTSKRKGKKRNNIVPFKQDLQVISNDNPVSARQAEIDKINHHAKEVFTKLGEFADSCKISVDEVWYNILYFAKQRAIHSTSYANFKINDKGTTDEVTANFAEFYNENFPELKVDKSNHKLQ